MTDKELCGCGKPVRYILGLTGNTTLPIGSCNKYSRCLSYSELEALAQKRKEMIVELLEVCYDLSSYRESTDSWKEALNKYKQINQIRKECRL